MTTPRKVLLLLLLCGLLCVEGAEVAGYHIDMETCSGVVKAGHNNATVERALCRTFFERLSNLTRAAARGSTSLPKPLKVAVDTGTAWTCPPEPSCKPPACGCINITWNGVSKPVGHHVVDIADESVLMDYSRDADQVYARARPFLQYADSAILADHLHRVRVGVAISKCVPGAPPTKPPCQTRPWDCRSDLELAELMAALRSRLQRHPSFAGFAVFYDSRWFAQRQHPAPTHTVWPQNTSVWYMNHSMVLDTDPAVRDAWLHWAKVRSIQHIFSAPRASNVPLLGNPDRETKFCKFLTQAAAQDINVYISGDWVTDYDLEFIKNCSTRHSTGP